MACGVSPPFWRRAALDKCGPKIIAQGPVAWKTGRSLSPYADVRLRWRCVCNGDLNHLGA